MPRRLVFPAQQQVLCEDFELPAPGPGQVRLRSRCSLMSTGTENICFNRLFDPGTHWDRWVKYPFYPGYSTVGVVEEVGPGVTNFGLGDTIVVKLPHASHHLVEADETEWPGVPVKVPKGLAAPEIAWFALAKIAAMAVPVADFRLGDAVVIIGAGPIGQMLLRWALAAGCERLIVIDPVSARLELARAGGATHTIAAGVDDATDAVLAANDGQAPKLVVDTTGNAKVFAGALELLAKYGKLVVLGDTGRPGQQHLSSAVMGKGLTIVAAHDSHETPAWDTPRILRLWFQLLITGRFSLAGLNTHTYRPEQCAEAYACANERRGETMGILFDWQ